jgi:hypothetical protein
MLQAGLEEEARWRARGSWLAGALVLQAGLEEEAQRRGRGSWRRCTGPAGIIYGVSLSCDTGSLKRGRATAGRIASAQIVTPFVQVETYLAIAVI